MMVQIAKGLLNQICKGNQMRNPSHPKIRIFNLEGLRDVESKKYFNQKLKKQSKSETSKCKIYPLDGPK